MAGFNLPEHWNQRDFERTWAPDEEPLPEAPDPDDMAAYWSLHSSEGIFIQD